MSSDIEPDQIIGTGCRLHPQLIIWSDPQFRNGRLINLITGIQFPVQPISDTPYVTTIVFFPAPVTSLLVTIPLDDEGRMGQVGSGRTFRNHALKEFIMDFTPDQLRQVTGRAFRIMGNRSASLATPYDVLTIVITGPDQPHLTILKLPYFQSDLDRPNYSLPDWYEKLSCISSILLPIRSCFESEASLREAQRLDKTGIRTLEIITDVNSLTPESESERHFINLAKKEVTNNRLGLGWHVIRTCRFEEGVVEDTAEWIDREKQFFQAELWKNHPRARVGMKSLHSRLGRLLLQNLEDLIFAEIISRDILFRHMIWERLKRTTLHEIDCRATHALRIFIIYFSRLPFRTRSILPRRMWHIHNIGAIAIMAREIVQVELAISVDSHAHFTKAQAVKSDYIASHRGAFGRSADNGDEDPSRTSIKRNPNSSARAVYFETPRESKKQLMSDLIKDRPLSSQTLDIIRTDIKPLAVAKRNRSLSSYSDIPEQGAEIQLMRPDANNMDNLLLTEQDLDGSSMWDLSPPRNIGYVHDDDMGDEQDGRTAFHGRIERYMRRDGLSRFRSALHESWDLPASELEYSTSVLEYVDTVGAADTEMEEDSPVCESVLTTEVDHISVLEYVEAVEADFTQMEEDPPLCGPVFTTGGDSTSVLEYVDAVEAAVAEMEDDLPICDPVPTTSDDRWRIEFSAGKTDITFSPYYRSTIVNDAKGWIEQFLHEPINWWPLSPRVTPPPEGFVLVHWTSVSLAFSYLFFHPQYMSLKHREGCVFSTLNLINASGLY